jgi:NAD+ synthase
MVGRAIHTITEEDIQKIVGFIKDIIKSTGRKGIVIGVSGGLDSAVAAKLCADAVGPENVHCMFMPSSITPAADRSHTEEMSRKWGTGYEVLEMQRAVDVFSEMLVSEAKAPLEKGNISARCRMIALYSRAKKLDCLVAGTSNRSEYMMGYFTKFGDGASDIAPLIGLYKTQVRQVAEIIGIPEHIIKKVPTAGLWEGQTDEDEMGITYRDLDIVLNSITFGVSDAEIAKDTGIGISKISEIRARVAEMEHKRIQAYRPDIIFNDP